ncbi:MAG: hypothetical protein IPM24_27315 [Bryobacterales bacterium]|nr:hypothetical protein [Bryobacterales bacterium]
MRFRSSVLVLASLAGLHPAGAGPVGGAGVSRPPTFHFHVASTEPGSWPAILEAIGLLAGEARDAGILVVRQGAPADPALAARVEGGLLLVLEGESPAAESFGFHGRAERMEVTRITDAQAPRLPIIWQESADLPRFTLPDAARVFAVETWTQEPVMAGMRLGAGAVLWVIANPGDAGYERFPYLPQALADLGLRPPVAGKDLWAFFDHSYRLRADPEYLARRWRRAGFAGLHVAAWHFFEPDPARDVYLESLIAACHRNGILVYAWLELPHVSEAFWQQHPQWREKTAVLQDAHLDWRKLMNLQNPDCFRAAAAGVRTLVERFDWDGVNLAELYFESLEGAANPSRFTPMNDDVRRLYREKRGIDPVRLFAPGRSEADLRDFLDFRAGLARRMQEEWMAEAIALRERKPHLDIVLTHVDDRFDSSMREAIGADAARVLPLVEEAGATFLIEDPATVWHLGPRRYPEIARRYQPLAQRPERLAIDINIVERYQDVYPTKQQTGVELLQLVHLASGAFRRVALYSESSLLPPDLALLPAAAARVSHLERQGTQVTVESPGGVGLAWEGPALVNGQVWPAASDAAVWLPPGKYAVEPAPAAPPLRLTDFNGLLRDAGVEETGIWIRYKSSSRALAVVDRKPARVRLNDADYATELKQGPAGWVVMLPRGEGTVQFMTE